MCWVADAYRQSCSYGPLARGGGCNRAEPAYDCSTLEAEIGATIRLNRRLEFSTVK